MITLARLAELLEAYGADPARWPAEEREAALALLALSPEARRRRDEAARLDALLDRVAAEPGDVPTASPALRERVVAAAGITPTTSDAVRTRDEARRRGDRPAARRPLPSRRGLAVALPFAAAAALALWLVWAGGSDPTMVAHAPSPVAVSPAAPGPSLADLEDYDAPTDDLLDVDGLEVVDALPTLGCTADEWGCPELDVGDERSTTDVIRRTFA